MMPRIMFQAARRPSIAATARLPLAAALLLLPALHLQAAAPAPKSAQKQTLQSLFGFTEVGMLDGTAYRIDVPTHWNHALVVFYHGYAQQPVTFHLAARLTSEQMPFFDRHYAVIQSAYSTPGWALQQAYPETESLRRYFTKQHGQPTATYAVGRSMGGDLVAITLELNPKPYLGGLDLCGAVGPTYQAMERRFAMRAAFDAYFPGVMPPLVPVPTGYEDNHADYDRVLAAVRANPEDAMRLRNLMGLRSDQDLAHDIAYWTFVIGDLQRRAGGNPFDNRNHIYTGTSLSSSAGDFELNETVKRYAAEPRARAYLMRHYTPNGHLGRPMLALHTIYDPIVEPSQLALYNHQVQEVGFGANLVQQVVDREGHCNFTEDEVGDAFDEMVRWANGGPRPTPGVLKP